MKKNDNSDFDLAVSVTKTIFGIFFTIFRLLYYGSKRLFFFWKSTRPLPAPKPYVLPVASRFEHMHIVAGSGYGKTQLLQQLIMHDLDEYRWGRRYVIVIDSQGDMIRKISRLDKFNSYRLIIIDPNDIENLPALNLFDIGLDRIEKYDAVQKEKLTNGAIALYEYLFGAILGAELTQKQGVIFRFLGRLMMTIPGATIHTLMGFMDNPESVRPYLTKLDPVSRRFFETQFLSSTFDSTRQQILTRLWGVVSNSVLERMFANEHNKVNLYEAMNDGNIILINTAKDLLKQEGCEIFGRFFIAQILQAAQERAPIPENMRIPTFLYIDEASDYVDQNIANIVNQLRKFKVGLVLAHQNLDQLDTAVQAAVMSSTSIKIVGGLSAKDAAVFAREMRCPPEFFHEIRKTQDHTEFACFIRNHTETAIPLDVQLGQMEKLPKLNAQEYQKRLDDNRARICAKPMGKLPEPVEANQ